MELQHSINELKKISLSMFRKNFLGVFHGSISARVERNQFLINKQNAIFDDIKDSDLTLLFSKKDYRWNEASMDAYIHLNIYKNINEAKFICYAMPPYTTAYAMKHDKIEPKDYFGYMKFHQIHVYAPKQFEDWYERAETEIYRYMLEKNTNIVVIKGYGIYAFSRTPQQLAKEIAILENSCKLLYLSNYYEKFSNELY
ncbi:class II aldolase/adducin family protein [Campylobacter sp. RM13119]|uniref:Class II aldolase/adducin family protein n=1 Tax=Campylobacter californiensis TaxID=1032243 RepID=A0ABD4JFT0_9BACT|nr:MULTISPECIES: class II aldolase and adducin N-terminal domain-containing protein [unclassified Campylobacter]MBE2985633.1 class II aldolase/adducin family protein [Campylobacter sp. RM12919]MBE2987338.1 class II aldolase/adducin family protein [Campylobacter sp. RM12920]MBE3022199.1 class II aldolase/adducin family protein [Campylobacter sp. 7477a]MBE3605443.1 class II aldolase/adducin family protein [Campylobacter sp. RM13119]MBE3609120.1 class II aldolase/adducin family protein [Campyloba